MTAQSVVELRASQPAQPAGGRRPLDRGRLRWALVLALQLLVFVVAIGGWSLAVSRGLLDEFYVSSPGLVWDALVAYVQTGDVWTHGWVTLRSTLLGFAIGSALGVFVGMVFARVPLLDQVFSPYLRAFNAMPRVALAPLFILWFGIGSASKVWFAVSLVFFIVLINTEAGIKSVDRELTTTARSMGATSQQVFVKIVLPGSVPTIFAGLRLGLVYSLLGVVFGEMLAASAGLGQQITSYAGRFQMSGVLATLVILAAISLLLNVVLAFAERRLLRWQ